MFASVVGEDKEVGEKSLNFAISTYSITDLRLRLNTEAALRNGNGESNPRSGVEERELKLIKI